MAEANPQVMEMIQAEIRKNKDVSNKELFEKATAIDKSIGKLSARQFNARYPLQVKRTMAPKRKAARRPTKSADRKAPTARKPRAAKAGGGSRAGQVDGGSRDRIRSVMLDLARAVANAQGKGDVIDVVAGIDRYVDRVLKATS